MDFHVDDWKIYKIEDINTNTKEEEEVFDGDKNIYEVESNKYLGQIISQDGKNVKNISNRANKGIGIVNKIETTLGNTPGGRYHFELAVVVRNSCINFFSYFL